MYDAEINLTARLLGRVNSLKPEQAKHLEVLRRSRDITGVYAGCPGGNSEE